jgi:hypothetical protein
MIRDPSARSWMASDFNASAIDADAAAALPASTPSKSE